MGGGGGWGESGCAELTLIINNFVDIQPLLVSTQCLIGVSAVFMATAFLKTDFSLLASNSIFIHFMGF